VFLAAGSILAFADDVVPDLADRMARSAEAVAGRVEAIGATSVAAGVLVLVLALATLSVVLSAALSVVVFHGYALSRAGEDLHRAHGLLTRRTSSLPRRRIQLVEVEEGLIRRVFGLAAVRADTAGNVAEGARPAGRDVVLPIARREEADAVVRELLPDVSEGPPAFQRVSRLAIRRATVKAAIVLGLAAAAAAPISPGLAVALLALVPACWGTSVLAWRGTGLAYDGRVLHARRGWWRRSTHVVPVRNVQAVVVRQTPFDRRLGLATLVVDTAGQAFTGGGPRVANLPVEEARRIAWDVARRAWRRLDALPAAAA
jgi:putative membrane protein